MLHVQVPCKHESGFTDDRCPDSLYRRPLVKAMSASKYLWGQLGSFGCHHRVAHPLPDPSPVPLLSHTQVFVPRQFPDYLSRCFPGTPTREKHCLSVSVDVPLDFLPCLFCPHHLVCFLGFVSTRQMEWGEPWPLTQTSVMFFPLIQNPNCKDCRVTCRCEKECRPRDANFVDYNLLEPAHGPYGGLMWEET